MPVEVNSASAAQRLAATVLRPGQAEHVAQCPEQRHLRIDIEHVLDAIDLDLHRLSSGHSAPVSTHAAVSAPNSAWVPGAGSRSAPGAQPHATSSSCPLCSTICARLFPPLRLGSLI